MKNSTLKESIKIDNMYCHLAKPKKWLAITGGELTKSLLQDDKQRRSFCFTPTTAKKFCM